MLIELNVSNFAIIDQLRLHFGPGLNILSGETGTGKSLVVDAMGGLLGERFGREIVRTGAREAHIEGIFDLSFHTGNPVEDQISAILAEHGLYGDDSCLLIISREISDSGRSVSRVNGRAVPLSVIKSLGSLLVDIHGQTEHLSLLNAKTHIDFLDGFGGLWPQRRRLASVITELRHIERELQRSVEQERERAQRADLLRFQVNDIEAAALREGEDEELLSQRQILSNAGKIRAACEAAHGLLNLSEDGSSVVDKLHQAQAALKGTVSADPSLHTYLSSLEAAAYQLEEVARDLRIHAESIEDDPQRLLQVEERIDLVSRLKRKYGDTISEILAFARRAQAELISFDQSEERRSELERKLSDLRSEAGALAMELSQHRTEAAKELTSAVIRELSDLAMAGVRFTVSSTQENSASGLSLPDGRCCHFDASGIDNVEFSISTNIGETMKSLTKVASGGETSRFMLALKSALRSADTSSTLVFDEIDIGIGGRSGEPIGKKLWSLALSHQVLCVTHLPQIAAFADVHYTVTKEVTGKRTVTKICRMEEEQRMEEIAAMLGGQQASEKVKASARELLVQADEWKKGELQLRNVYSDRIPSPTALTHS